MRSELCEFEDGITSALATGQWSEELGEHVNGCAHCAELKLAWQALAQVAADEEAAPLPAPGLIWWRSQLVERREQAERAMAAIALMYKLAIAVFLIAVVPLLRFWKPDVWTILVGVSMVLATGGVLYGWARGRI